VPFEDLLDDTSDLKGATLVCQEEDYSKHPSMKKTLYTIPIPTFSFSKRMIQTREKMVNKSIVSCMKTKYIKGLSGIYNVG
jgi:hypothetical protein